MKLYEVCVHHTGLTGNTLRYYFIVQCDQMDQAETLAKETYKELYPLSQGELTATSQRLMQVDFKKAVWFQQYRG